jgi:Protein of unknown function (DUF1570)
MKSLAMARSGSGEVIRTRGIEIRGQRQRQRGFVLLSFVGLSLVALWPDQSRAQSKPKIEPARDTGPHTTLKRATGAWRVPIPIQKIGSRPQAQARGDQSPPSQGEGAPAASAAKLAPPPAKRFKIRDELGHCVVARLHGQHADKTVLILPDGQLGIPNMLVPTDEPFRPLSSDELEQQLHGGPFAEFQLLKTEHYLIFYQSTLAFAQDSGRLLEDLYQGLQEELRRNGFPVHESEFPLVAVIFATEKAFRAHKPVDSKVQAYYEFFTNRIFFYQRSKLDKLEPKVTSLLKPQTVAHEGAHQILSNIGVQPRLSEWPLWLIEGLAEYCAPTTSTKRGILWAGFGAINALNMATLRELADPISIQINSGDPQALRSRLQKGASRTEALLLKTELTPTDYAEAWALTHYLIHRRTPDFFKYLKAMSEARPLEPRTPQDRLAEFSRFFGPEVVKLDKRVDDYIRKLSQKKGYDPLPYYAVVFEQSLGQGLVLRAVVVSQSWQIIEQFIKEKTVPGGGDPTWQAYPWQTRARAQLFAEQWMRQY